VDNSDAPAADIEAERRRQLRALKERSAAEPAP
jgi:hypothetical protein